MNRVIAVSVVAVGSLLASVSQAQLVYYPTTTYYAPTTYYSPATTAAFYPSVTTSYYAPTATTTYYQAPMSVYYGGTPVVMNYYRPLVGNMTRVRYAPVTVAYPTPPTTVYYRY